MLMAVLEPVPAHPDTASVWVGLNGQIISCDATFTDWFAYQPQELTNTPVSNLAIRAGDKMSG